MSSEVEKPQGHRVSEAQVIDRSKSTAANFERQSSSGNQTTSALSSSAGGLSTTPVQAVTAYLKNLLGLSAKPTKRTLSEEAECGSPDSLREWLRQGSDPNEVDAYGYTPLVNACLRGCKKSATVLLANGADPNKKAIHGYTPLHAAAQNGFFELVELLADHGANLETKNEDGDTPLMLAVRSDHPEVVDALCKRGCDMHTHGFDNIDPIDYALSKRNLYLSDVLLKHERQHSHVHPLSPLAIEKNSSPSPPSATNPIAASNIEPRHSLTGMLIEEQEARDAVDAASQNKSKLERLDSENEQEANTGNAQVEPIFQSE